MHIGGVLIAAGMELDLHPGDYHEGERRVRLLISRIISADRHWILLDGTVRPTSLQPWTSLRVYVRIDALKRSLSLL